MLTEQQEKKRNRPPRGEDDRDHYAADDPTIDRPEAFQHAPRSAPSEDGR
jgi:hypothetical protein